MNHTDDIIVCIPLFNDWESVSELLPELDRIVGELGLRASILLIDDASTEATPPFAPVQFVRSVEILRLRRNLGHQRAIALGLTYVYCNRSARTVAVMDGDGEDAPEDLGRLFQRCGELGFSKLIFARRTRRTETLFFKAGYVSFRVLHWLLTGVAVNVGNFSVMPWSCLSRLVAVSEMWNHYAAAVTVSRLPVDKIPVARAHRLLGKSKMNLTALVTHGLRAISVYEQVGVRMLFANAVVTLGVLSMLTLTTQGSALLATLIILGLLTMSISCMTFVLLGLQNRNAAQFVPLRDYEYYLAGNEVVSTTKDP